MADYNPSDHSVNDVKAHLEKNPEELQAVLDAEKAGKNRTTLVSALEDQAQSVPVAAEPKPVTVEPAPVPGLLDQFEVSPERGHRRKQS